MLEGGGDSPDARSPWRWYSVGVALLFGVLVFTGTTMSSIGIGHMTTDGTDHESRMIGTPRSIRSDEWQRTSPWRIGALVDRDTSFATPLAADGELLTGTVTRGAVSRVVLFESLLADLGSFLPHSVGFALLWWAPSVLFWLFAPRLLGWFGVPPVLAVLTTGAMYLSPAVMWWSLGTVNSGLATSIPAGLLLLRAVGSAKLRPTALGGCLLAGLLIARIPFSYAPWAIVNSIGVLVPTTFVAVSRFGWRRTLKVLAVIGALAGIALVATILEHRAGFESLRETIYPGSRRSTARALDIGFLFGAPHLGVLKTTSVFVGTNASEISTALTVLAVPCVLYAFATVGRWRTRLTAAWWGHAVVFAMFFAWISVDLPANVGERLPLFSLLTPERTAQVVGFIATSWFAVTVTSLRNAPRAIAVRVGGCTAVVIASLVALSGSVLRTQHLPVLRPFHVLVNAVVIAICVGVPLSWADRRWSMLPLTVFALVMAIGVNPVIVGLGDLRSSHAATTVRQINRTSPGYWVTDSSNVDSLLMANAVPSLSGQQWTGPDAANWQKLDPTSAFHGSWNRGAAFIRFDFDPAAPGPQIGSPHPDVITVRVDPCDRRLVDMNVRVLVSSKALERSCLSLHTRFRWAGVDRLVYGLKAGTT